MSTSIVAWGYADFRHESCAVIVSHGTFGAPIMHTPLTPAAARKLAQELLQSADYIDSLLAQKGLETNEKPI